MAKTFLQLMAFSATVDFTDNKEEAALAADLCEKVSALVAQNKYASLNIVGWTLEENMRKWASDAIS